MTTPKTPSVDRFVRYSPEWNIGTIFQTIVFLGGLGVGYGTYTADQSRQDSLIEKGVVIASRDREEFRKSTQEIKERLDKQADKLDNINESLAILRGRAAK